MKDTTAFQVSRLREALADFSKLPTIYPILAEYGEMERTANGFKAIAPDVIIRRARRTLALLESGRR